MSVPACALRKGDCFRFKNSDPHLWIVASEPERNPEKVLMVNVTSMRRHADMTCVLGPNDHPYIRHESFIYYAAARVNSAAQLNYLYNSEKIELDERIDDAVLKRVADGFFASIHAERGHVDLLLDQLF